jgi:hypothetical protein
MRGAPIPAEKHAHGWNAAWALCAKGSREVVAREEQVILKLSCSFSVKLLLRLPDGTLLLVDGKELVGRPEERLKKRVRTW